MTDEEFLERAEEFLNLDPKVREYVKHLQARIAELEDLVHILQWRLAGGEPQRGVDYLEVPYPASCLEEQQE
jgi:hypothetical protein